MCDPKSMIQAMEMARCHDVCHLNPDSMWCCRTLSRSLLFSVSQAFRSQAGSSVYGADVADAEVQRDR